ncbi:Protein CBR-EIF-3.F [Caenorhabditis briggsae]|uniref:Protein CBR-EIF-3.F n=1 Tax=Caenorhabditis briggsae TaxID=6238 RepID=A8XXC2_CAEBR|nr:Protein CBR-EIF-3.F [Caenorhabditis briggsae]CAP37291.2 Protein CBR-EIF-3.F [Caenorhabditis briggsae]
MGTLMGYYEKGSIQVTNCFAIPFNESNDDLEIDDQFNQQMISALKKTSPNEQPVGWFLTTSDITSSCLIYHDYYVVSSPKHRHVMIIRLITPFSGDMTKRMPVRAYLRSKAGIPGAAGPHCAIFNPLRVELAAFPGELVAMQLMEKALDSRRREATLESGLEQLEVSTAQMIEWLERMLSYVEGVNKDGEKPGDAQIGRQLMDIVTSSSNNMQPDKLDALVKNTLRDYVMVSYLAKLTQTQLQVHERLVSA